MSDVRLRFIYIHLSLCDATISNGTIANGLRGNSFWQYAHKLLSIMKGYHERLIIVPNFSKGVLPLIYWFICTWWIRSFSSFLTSFSTSSICFNWICYWCTRSRILEFLMWISKIPSFLATTTEWLHRRKYLKPLQLHFTKYVALTVTR